jgi:GTPase Era involved in 16S rRNA processing
MVSDALKPNVQDLQQNVIELLGQIIALMDRASTELGSDGTSEKYVGFQQEVTKAALNVEDLELRMAIVAPMKAGKSTIINAIVGQEILPNRNAAMTTLPTEIIFDAKLTEPLLSLSPEIQDVFQDTFFRLQRKIREFGNERVQEKIAQYPHLANLASGIQSKTGGSIPEKVSGRQRIINNLGALNDIVRLCSLLEPLADPLQSLTEVPRIRTPFWRSQTTEQSNLLGNLVIIDTPGPNEAGENLRLVNVVSEQLQNSSLVLLVLDFTQLRTEAAEKVKQDVQKVIELRGKENLYVLINKVDQRRQGDMTPEQVQQFVAAELGIGGSDNTDRVFEVSARWAFSAANFMQELQQHPNISVAQMKTAQALAQEVFGIVWEEQLEDATVEYLEKQAERLWKKSGFAPFLEKAVSALMEEAAPRCIMSALNIARSRLVELRDGVKLRRSAIVQDAEKLKAEVDRLKQDLSTLNECRNNLRGEVEAKKNGLSRGLRVELKHLKERSEEELKKYFLEELNQRLNQVQELNLWNQVERLDAKFRKILLREVRIPIITDIFESIFPKSISKAIKDGAELLGRDEIKFQSKSEAEEFAEQLCVEAKQIVEGLLRHHFTKIKHQIQDVQKGLNFSFRQRASVVIKQARNRLNETFNVALELPELILEGSINTNSLTPFISAVKRKKNFLEITGDFFKSIFNFYQNEAESDDNLYTVSLEKTVKQINSSIEEKLKETEKDINKYLDEDFQQRMDDFFNSLDSYLQNYQDSLTQALKDQGSSLESQEDVKNLLNKFSKDASIFLAETEKKVEFTRQLMPKIN